MNASQRKFAAGLLLATTAAALAACAGRFSPETDPSSPVAARVEQLVAANREYPRWEDFPRATPPVPDAEIAANVGALHADRGQVASEVAAIQWEVGDEASAAAARQSVAASAPSAASAETQAEIEDFARRTRDRGRAPPPVDRR